MPTPPPQLPAEGILIGYSLEHERRTAPIGFVYGETRAARSAAAPAHLTPILHTGGGHLMTIAPTGAGKGVSCIIPTLLRFPGPVIVIDPKGENYAVTAERRRALGQTIVLLDPMGITGAPGDALNPLDLIDADAAQSIDDATMLASLLSGGVERDDPRNLFWYQRGEALLTGLIQFVATEAADELRNLSEVRRLLNLPNDEFIAFARTRLQRATDEDVRQIAGTLVNPAEEMIGSIVGMSQNSLGFLRGELLHRATARSTFDLHGVTRGDPLSIYVVIPPDKLRSHQNLLRVWVGTLMAALMRRRAPVDHDTLFILDEAAQLGPLEQLRQAITLLRGYGLQTWSFWQDHSQLRNLYPLDWQTMYNNCRVHQAFGFATLQAANEITQLTGFHDPLAALQLDGDEMLLSISGDETVIAQKPNYLTDPAFAGLFAGNPFYARTLAAPPKARETQRVYRRPSRGGRDAVGAAEGAVNGSGGGSESADDAGPADASRPSFDALLAETVLSKNDVPRVFGAVASDEPAVPAPLLFPGGLSPLPHTALLTPAELTSLLSRIEQETGDRWDRFSTIARSLIIIFNPSGSVLYDVVQPQAQPARALYVDTGKLRRWTGGAHEVLSLLGGDPPILAGGAANQYAHVWLRFTRRDGVRLRVVENVPGLAYHTDRSAAELSSFGSLLRPLEIERDGEGRKIAAGTALAGGDLVSFRLRLEGATGPEIEAVELVRESAGPTPHRIRPHGDAPSNPARQDDEEVWEVTTEPERSDFLSWLDARDAARIDADAPIVRRTIACYPGVDLVRVPPRPGRNPLLFLWAGAQPLRLLLSTLPDTNAAHLRLDDAQAFIAYLRLFVWLRFDGDMPVGLLDDRADLLRILGDAPDLSEYAETLDARWSGVEVEGIDAEGDATLAFTALIDGDVLIVEASIDTRGGIGISGREGLLQGLPIDFERLRAFHAWPKLDGGAQ